MNNKPILGNWQTPDSETASGLQIRNQIITPEEIIPLLVSYELLPRFLNGLVIDRAIAPVQCTDEEIVTACQQFYQRHQLNSLKERQAWLARYGITQEQLEAIATRALRIEKFKQATWGHKLEPYFLRRKAQLDKVIYSLVRVKDIGIANELYFRLQAGEQSFAELARAYAQGPEANTGGLVGPIALGSLHPTLAQLLCVNQPGQLRPPLRLGDWIVILKLEKFIPAQLDEFMRRQLLNELFQTWLEE